MAEAVADAMDDGRHLLVQAGTGTGKSLAYLVPGAAPRPAGRGRDRDPRAPAPARRARHPAAGRGGRATYPGSTRRTPCSRAAPTTPACTASARACPTTRARWSRCPRARWARRSSSCGPGPRRRPRTGAAASATTRPRHTDREWRQVSVSHRECLGRRASARSAQECFAELAREKAHRSHLIVTNHSLLAIDAIEGVPMIPDYDVVVIDEAHELVARVTQAATDELFAADVDRAARRSPAVDVGRRPRPTTSPTPATRCAAAIADVAPGRFDELSPSRSPTRWCWCATRARACLSAYPKERRRRRGRRRPHPGQRLGAGGVRHRRADGRRLRGRRAVADRGAARPASRRGCASRRCRCGARCATSCSPTRPWCSPARP